MSYKELKSRYSGPSGIDWRYVYKRRPWQQQIVNKQWSQRNISNFTNDGVHGQVCPRTNVAHKLKWLVASDNIDAGEELLLSYGRGYWHS